MKKKKKSKTFNKKLIDRFAYGFWLTLGWFASLRAADGVFMFILFFSYWVAAAGIIWIIMYFVDNKLLKNQKI